MTSPEPIDQDGSLPDAKRRLEDAVSALVDPQCEVADGRPHWIDSVYVQLLEALPGEQGSGHGVARSLPPMWLDCADLKNEIDTAVSAWIPRPLIDLAQGDPGPLTVIRLQQLEGKSWRPQDCRSMDQISGNIESWTASIKTLLSPIPRWHLPNPCPACNAQVVYRKDSSGDTVRQPALQIGPNGCECAKCHQLWEPSYFTHLARVLGYELPAGVLE